MAIVRGGMGEVTLTAENQRVFERYANEINTALAAGAFERLPGCEAALLDYVRANAPQLYHEYNVKRIKTEFVRIYVTAGRWRDAERVARSMLQMVRIDVVSINRESMVRQVIARIMIDSGDTRRARAELLHAIALSKAVLAEIVK